MAACGGDDNVTPAETGGSAGTSDSGKGGGGGDASPDRSDARGPDAVADRGTGGATMDVSAETGGGPGVDSGREGSTADVAVEAAPDRGPDVVPDVVTVPDVAAEARVDAAADQVAEASPPTPDANDGGARPDVVEAGPTPEPTPEAAPPEPVPEAAPEATVDAGQIDSSDAPAALTIPPSQVTGGWTNENDQPLTPNDAGLLTWTTSTGAGGGIIELRGSFTPPQNWSAYATLAIRYNVVSVTGTVTSLGFVHGGDGGITSIFSDNPTTLVQGETQTVFLNLAENLNISSGVNDAGIQLTTTGTATVTIEVVDIVASN